MITSIYRGGLGNLLFQVSVGYIFSKNNNTEYKINCSLDKGRGQGNPISHYINNIFKNIETTEITPLEKIKEESFDIKKQMESKDFLLDGFFQKAIYIESNKSELNKLFNFNSIKPKDEKTKVCTIQIRTGDYENSYNDIFNVITPQYIKNSMDYVLNIFPNVHFYLVTDCYESAKKFFFDKYNITYSNLGEMEDLKLMSQSDVCIISNSTFGWWGSFLGKNKITLSPQIWFKNDTFNEIYRKDMIKINVN